MNDDLAVFIFACVLTAAISAVKVGFALTFSWFWCFLPFIVIYGIIILDFD